MCQQNINTCIYVIVTSERDIHKTRVFVDSYSAQLQPINEIGVYTFPLSDWLKVKRGTNSHYLLLGNLQVYVSDDD